MGVRAQTGMVGEAESSNHADRQLANKLPKDSFPLGEGSLNASLPWRRSQDPLGWIRPLRDRIWGSQRVIAKARCKVDYSVRAAVGPVANYWSSPSETAVRVVMMFFPPMRPYLLWSRERSKMQNLEERLASIRSGVPRRGSGFGIKPQMA
jgi:hypothetical protein